MMNRIHTAHDARNAKRLSDARFAPTATDKAREQAEADARQVLANHPHIGELVRKGKKVYYRNYPTYVESNNPRNLI